MQCRTYLLKSACALLLSLLASLQASGQTGSAPVASQLEPPNHQVTILDSPGTLRPAAMPHWEGRYLVSGTFEVKSPQPNVSLYDQSGTRVRKAAIWFPDSVRVSIFDAAVTPQGNIVASGYAAKSDGTFAYFIAKTDLSGAVTQVIRTNPFLASKVCALDEDSVWTYGDDLNKNHATLDYKMLRNYSFSQGLLHAYVPRSAIKIPVGGIVVGKSMYWMRCSGSKVAVYVGMGPDYFQLNVAHNTLDRFHVERMPGDMMVTGFALTDTGHVFASLEVTGDGTLGLRGLFELKVDTAAKQVQWVPVQSTLTHFQSWEHVQEGAFWDLLGTDGTNLIYNHINQYRTLLWAKPIIQKAVASATAP